MSLLALDLATVTGYAVGDPELHERLTALEAYGRGDNAKPFSGSHRIAPPGTPLGVFCIRYEDWLGDMLLVHQATHVVFEAPWVGGKTSQDVARKLMGLAILTETVATRAKVPWIREANNASVRKHFIGKGRGDRKTLKRLTIEACQNRGWEPRNDDEADALALFDYACHCLAA